MSRPKWEDLPKLFDEASRPKDPPAWYSPNPSAGRFNRNVRAGLHPIGLRLGDPGNTCGDCRFFHRTGERHTRSFFKCGKYRDTRSQATDVRGKWRSCELFEERCGS